MTSAEHYRDFLASAQFTTIAWIIPGAFIVVAANLGLSQSEQAFVWASALAWMGAACLVNARRCGRTHCYFTGPFFLALATLSLGKALSVDGLATLQFDHIGLALLIGGPLLYWLPEKLQGQYWR